MKVETLGESDKTPPINYICGMSPVDDRAVSELLCMYFRMMKKNHDNVRNGDYLLFSFDFFEYAYMPDGAD